MTTLVLGNEHLQLAILPGLGGGIARFDALMRDGRKVSVMRPSHGIGDRLPADPNLLACYPLLPWSNRIGQGRFEFEGRTVEVPRTRDDEPLPIHGHAWLAPWQLVSASPTVAVLTHVHADGPFRYTAWQSFALDGKRLSVQLAVRNEGERLPFGLGLHPFFPRTPATTLRAPASVQWHAGEDHLPTTARRPAAPANFGSAARLADGLNHAFGGWDGRAALHWPEHGLRLAIEADADRYVLYTPAGADFFCFEPVDHPINAHNLPGGARANGLTPLHTGQSLARRFRFTVAPMAAASASAMDAIDKEST